MTFSPRSLISRFTSPPSVLGVLLIISGALLLWMNVGAADESWWLGMILSFSGWNVVFSPASSSARKIAVSLGSLWLVLLGAELAVRRENSISQQRYAGRLMQFVDDPDLRYRFKPGATCGPSTIGPQGRLDPPRSLQKNPGTIRVACLGDSVGGDCSLPNDNACAALERELSAARGGRSTEVINFSVPGYNTLQEARALEIDALPFEPDAVVVLYVINDPYPDLAISHHLPGTLKFEHLLYSGMSMAAAKVIPSLDPLGSALTTFYEQPRGWDGVVVRGFDRIEKVARARDLPVIVAIFPLFVDPISEPQRRVYEKVATEARRHGFIALDLSSTAFANRKLTDLLKPSRDLIHPNAEAHQLVANTIANALAAARPGWVAP